MLSSLQLKFIASADAFAHALQSHPRRVAATVGALLLGTGSIAFGVANVAALEPGETQVPVRQIEEVVQSLDLHTQAAQLDTFSFSLYRTETIRPSDTADTLLKRLNVSDAAAAAYLRSLPLARAHLFARAGKTVNAEVNDDQTLRSLTARWSLDDTHFQRLVIERTPSGFTPRLETALLTPSTRLASGVVRSSLFAATDEARVPDNVATQLVEIFGGDIDFHRALRKGDRFSLVYETLNADGEPLKAGRLISAEFVNGGRSVQAMWFQEPGGRGQYFGFDGKSLKKAFLASPLEFSRVTSGFGMRVHPIARDWRAHKGVDYAAPSGTPVRTVGDGVVEFAGVQRGYGNVVEVKHRDGKATLFAHLSRIDVKPGQRVEQGQLVGAVGSTGWSTGPHLHFEFRINGEHQDPSLLAQQAESSVVSASARSAFERQSTSLRSLLASASSVLQAGAQ